MSLPAEWVAVVERLNGHHLPAVTEVWRPQAAHSNRPEANAHASAAPHFGHRKPSGHRSCTKYARHASAVAKRPSKSVRLLG